MQKGNATVKSGKTTKYSEAFCLYPSPSFALNCTVRLLQKRGAEIQGTVDSRVVLN